MNDETKQKLKALSFQIPFSYKIGSHPKVGSKCCVFPCLNWHQTL